MELSPCSCGAPVSAPVPPTPAASRRVAVLSVGCRTNQEEMLSLRARLAARGYSLVETPETADIVVLNTCVVTGGTEAKVRRLIHSLGRRAPGAALCVTGCLAQFAPQELALFANVRWVVGNTAKDTIERILSDSTGGVFHDNLDKETCRELPCPSRILPPGRSGRTRFSVKIQEGCNLRCTYCIVPAVRGRSRSAPGEAVARTVRRAAATGYREIVLTGTHIGQYRSSTGERLEDLLARVTALDGDFRIRLSSLDPRDLSDAILERAGSDPRVCRHLHVSFQSLCDPVLARMGRPEITADRIVERLAAARSRWPDLALGADIIVGFPGETLEMFRTTLENMGKIGLSYGHVFRFSARAGTAAQTLDGRVGEAEKARRSGMVRESLAKSRAAFATSRVDTLQRIVVEEEFPAAGLTANYLRAVVPGQRAVRNEWLDIRLGPYDPAQGRCMAHRVCSS